jgi:cytochrome c5
MQRRRTGMAMLSRVVWILMLWMSVEYQPAELAAQGLTTSQSNEQLEIEKGRTTVGQTCVPCHANIVGVIQLHKKSANEWRDTLYSMIGRGAQVLPEEIEPVIAFLVANAGRKPTQALAVQLPAAEGKAILERTCQRCHDLTVATTKPSEDWKTVIGKMITYGAVVTATDEQKLIEYLNGLTR